jgi:hypothetical protein
MVSTANTGGAVAGGNYPAESATGARTRRLTTETKASFKTTEFFAYLASVAAILIASATVDSENGHADYFRADKAWLYVVILTVGYMISRGLAKSGSRDPYDTK